MKINLVSNGTYLIPALDEDKEKFHKAFTSGDVLEVSIKKVRNYKFHKKYWALLKLVFENLPDNFCLVTKHQYLPITTIQDLHFHIKMKAALYEKKMTWGGIITYQVKSIAFDKMDNIEFSEFYDKVFDIIINHFLIGSEKRELEAEIAAYF